MIVVTRGSRYLRTHALAGIACVVLAFAAGACDKVPLSAPSGSSLSLSADSAAVPLGGSTKVTAFVAESSGTPVQNGTVVTFRATLGTLSAATAETRNGFATTTFTAGQDSGVAEVRATSGTIGTGSTTTTTTPGSGTTTGTTTTTTSGGVVQIAVGTAAAKSVVVAATPSSVSASGSTVTVVASVLDANGNRMPGVPVFFSTTSGTLSAASATTDSSGQAQVTLTANRPATVTATAGVQSGKVDITATALVTVGLAVSPNPGSVGQPVTLTVTPPAGTTTTPGPTPRVVINWGDGTSTDLGIVSGSRAVPHSYSSAGTFTITASSTGDGDASTSSITVTIAPRAPLGVSVEAAPGTSVPNVGNTTRLTASVTPAVGGADVVQSYTWTFSDGATVTTTSNTIQHVFTTNGRHFADVTVQTTDGRSATSRTEFIITGI